jgi:hypothetical protein
MTKNFYFEGTNIETNLPVCCFDLEEEVGTLEEAVQKFIHFLENVITENEDTDRNVTLAVIRKLVRKEFKITDKSNEEDVFILIEFCNAELETIKNAHYEFEVFYTGTLEYAATWDCNADSERDAVLKFIHQLSDLSICVDEYDKARCQAIIKKLAGKEYELNDDEHFYGTVYIITTITADDIYQFI